MFKVKINLFVCRAKVFVFEYFRLPLCLCVSFAHGCVHVGFGLSLGGLVVPW